MFLYQLRDMQLAALAPWHFAALAMENLLRHPFVQSTPAGRSLAADAALWERNTRFYPKPDFNIVKTRFRGEIIDVRERLIDISPFCRLVGFVRASTNPEVKRRAQSDPHVLIVAPLSGHFASLLRGTVEALLPSHNVFVTDWIDARLVPLAFGSFALDDQISLIASFIQKIGADLHLIAIGQSCAPTLAATALLAKAENPVEPRSLTLIGGAVDTQKAASALSEVALSHPLSWFQETRIQLVPPYYPGAFRAVYPGFMQFGNRMSLALNRGITEQSRYFDHLTLGCEETDEGHESLYDAFLSVMDIPAELYMDIVQKIYQQNALAQGALFWRGRKIDLSAIQRTALLTIEGEMDDLAPPGETFAAHDLCDGIPASMKQAHLEIGVGTFGTFTGRKWRNNIEPKIHQFIRQYSQSPEETARAL